MYKREEKINKLKVEISRILLKHLVFNMLLLLLGLLLLMVIKKKLYSYKVFHNRLYFYPYYKNIVPNKYLYKCICHRTQTDGHTVNKK